MGGRYDTLTTVRQSFSLNLHLQEIEATLHCIMSIQEAVPIDDSPHLTRLFSTEVLGLLPNIGHDRVRRTMLVLSGTL